MYHSGFCQHEFKSICRPFSDGSEPDLVCDFIKSGWGITKGSLGPDENFVFDRYNGASNKEPMTDLIRIWYSLPCSLVKNKKAMDVINEARRAFYEETCIFFVQKPDDWNGAYIQFFDDGNCHSLVGKKGNGMQQVTSQQ